MVAMCRINQQSHQIISVVDRQIISTEIKPKSLFHGDDTMVALARRIDPISYSKAILPRRSLHYGTLPECPLRDSAHNTDLPDQVFTAQSYRQEAPQS
jgi:hypothetical protein